MARAVLEIDLESLATALRFPADHHAIWARIKPQYAGSLAREAIEILVEGPGFEVTAEGGCYPVVRLKEADLKVTEVGAQSEFIPGGLKR